MAATAKSPSAQAGQSDAFSEISDGAENAFVTQEKLVIPPQGWPNDFIEASWRWHLLSTKIIFVCVIIVVMFGLLVSWMQFRDDITHMPPPPRAAAPGEETEHDAGAAYDFAASLNSVSVKSKTIGALVLVFSGVFFFLYLKFVYPVTVVNQDNPTSASTSSTSPPGN